MYFSLLRIVLPQAKIASFFVYIMLHNNYVICLVTLNLNGFIHANWTVKWTRTYYNTHGEATPMVEAMEIWLSKSSCSTSYMISYWNSNSHIWLWDTSLSQFLTPYIFSFSPAATCTIYCITGIFKFSNIVKNIKHQQL